MRLLIALAGGFTAYLIVGLFLGVAPNFRRRARQRREPKLQRWLVQVGSPLTPVQFLAASIGIGVIAWLLLTFVLGDWLASFFPAAALSGYLAWTYERRRRDRLRSIEEAWPDAIRHLLSYVRSGSTVPLAVASLATQGPEALRPVFDGWSERARLLGFAPALESVREQLADPTSDRVIEVLLIAHEWGGELVATVLSDLADEITEDLRTKRAIRAEGTTQRIESWVVGIAPWLLLIYLTATQGPYRTYYQTGAGRVVLLAAGLWWGMGLIVLAMMKKQEREPRVLGAGAEESPA
ncbi:MAG: type II secretion system F family protein [Thermoanaerobaculales bacterium]